MVLTFNLEKLLFESTRCSFEKLLEVRRGNAALFLVLLSVGCPRLCLLCWLW
uniref:Uncharacterized protein n=1 Tax=Arundo donax TaxID=35708 RepID=A0A0A9GH92_ARUDO